MFAQYALLLTVPVALFFGIAFVVLLFAFGKRDFSLDQVFFPIERGTHTGIALLLGGFKQSGQLFAVQQQFAGAGGIAHIMRGHGLQRGDLGASQPGLTIFEQNVALGDLYLAGAGAFHFPAVQGNTGFKFVGEVIVVTSSLVEGDRRTVLFWFLGSHGRAL